MVMEPVVSFSAGIAQRAARAPCSPCSAVAASRQRRRTPRPSAVRGARPAQRHRELRILVALDHHRRVRRCDRRRQLRRPSSTIVPTSPSPCRRTHAPVGRVVPVIVTARVSSSSTYSSCPGRSSHRQSSPSVLPAGMRQPRRSTPPCSPSSDTAWPGSAPPVVLIAQHRRVRNPAAAAQRHRELEGPALGRPPPPPTDTVDATARSADRPPSPMVPSPLEAVPQSSLHSDRFSVTVTASRPPPRHGSSRTGRDGDGARGLVSPAGIAQRARSCAV